jgi:hypothetical protein
MSERVLVGDRFNATRTIEQGIKNELAVLLDQIVDVAKDTTVSCQEPAPFGLRICQHTTS